jgi:deoxyribonuclease V
MKLSRLHDWPETGSEAVALQRQLAPAVDITGDLPQPLRYIAGVDVSYEKHGDLFFAAIVVLDWPGLQLVEQASASALVKFPYVPGLLSFRELPVLLEAFRSLNTIPDVVLVDGQGIAHPRRLGLASHLGLWLQLPTIGCAKSRLCGEFSPPDEDKGSATPLFLQGETVGTVLRSRSRVKPLFVSPGHRISVAAASNLVLASCRRYRLPEPTRRAHLLTNELRRASADPAFMRP